jgi:type I restriction enzyme S subunit
VRSADLPANTNQAVSIVRLFDPTLAPWLITWLSSPKGQATLTAGGRGVGLQNLNLGQIGDVAVPIPPPDRRRRIVAEIEEQLSLLDSLRTAVELAQKRSYALRRAILERAFRGELVPQDPDDEPASVLLERIRAERAAAPRPKRWRRVTA